MVGKPPGMARLALEGTPFMLRVEYGRYGGPEELHLADVPSGPLGKDQIRIRVKAASVNPVDWKIRLGMLKIMTGRRLDVAWGIRTGR